MGVSFNLRQARDSPTPNTTDPGEEPATLITRHGGRLHFSWRDGGRASLGKDPVLQTRRQSRGGPRFCREYLPEPR